VRRASGSRRLLFLAVGALLFGALGGYLAWRTFVTNAGPPEQTRTFGKLATPEGARTCGTTSGHKVAFKHSLPEAGTVSAVSVFLNGLREGAGSQPIEAVIYDDDGANGAPGTLLATSEIVAIPDRAPFQWVEFPLATPVTLARGRYYLGFLMGGNPGTGRDTHGAYLCELVDASQRGNVDAYANGPSEVFGRADTAPYSASIYATYRTTETRPADRRGPLRVLPSNPRYFTTDGVTPVYLTGSHTWWNLVDGSPADPPAAFDFKGYLSNLGSWGHNFVRLWAWDLTRDTVLAGVRPSEVSYRSPQPFARTGPGNALDGKPKFDLTQLNDDYFERLRQRVRQADDAGIYVSIMLFEGYGPDKGALPFAYDSHPFAKENNVNDIDGDVDGDGRLREVYRLPGQGGAAAVNDAQKEYVRAVVDAVTDLDNVLFEIANEAPDPTTDWQYDMIEFVKSYEATKDDQHPVGMTFQWRDGDNRTLFESPADWISTRDPLADLPAATGTKVIVSDTDHHCGYCGADADWAWKEFMRGRNPIFMDPYGVWGDYDFENPADVSARRGMGQTAVYATTMDLAAAVPRSDVSSTKYALAATGSEFLVYQPEGGSFTVNLEDATSRFAVEWLDPASGKTHVGDPIAGGRTLTFTPPFGGPAVLYLRSE
jgi:Family of unknown function (DUF6298)/Putative collagen-binding domain of a collagenase